MTTTIEQKPKVTAKLPVSKPNNAVIGRMLTVDPTIAKQYRQRTGE